MSESTVTPEEALLAEREEWRLLVNALRDEVRRVHERNEALEKGLRWRKAADAVHAAMRESPSLVGVRVDSSDDFGGDVVKMRWACTSIDRSGRQHNLAIDHAYSRTMAQSVLADVQRRQFMALCAAFYDAHFAGTPKP